MRGEGGGGRGRGGDCRKNDYEENLQKQHANNPSAPSKE